jgi:pimeloyl-ACP methyl ester carboxylesterase
MRGARGTVRAPSTMKNPAFPRLAITTCLLGALAACSSDDGRESLSEEASAFVIPEPPEPIEPLLPEVDDLVSRTPWQPVGFGVSYKSFDGSPLASSNVVILYGGYTAEEDYVQRWANEMVRVKAAALGIGHLYAVKGPNRAGYDNHEIHNSKLAAHLAAEGRAAGAQSVVVIAHSSGTYVADELLRMLRDGAGGVPASTIAKVRLFNLDGGGVSNAALLRQLGSAYFVFACDGAIGRCSHNASSMRSLGAQYASLGGAQEMNARGSQCSREQAGGLWCLHDTVITTRPHNPVSYDLRRDYTDFANGRELVTAYLDALP